MQCLPAGSFTFDRPLKSKGGGGGGYSVIPYRYVPPYRVAFLCLFCLKTGIHFAHFGLGSDMLFEGTTGVYEYLSFQLQMNKKEREICELEMDLNFFTSNLSNDDIISARKPGLKTDMDFIGLV